MKDQMTAMAALLLFWGCLCMAGCSKTGPVKSEPEVGNGYDALERVSRRMPEVEILAASDGAWKKVQLISLEGRVLKFRTFPLKGVTLTPIQVSEIAEIRMMKKKRGAVTGALAGLAPGIGLPVIWAFGNPNDDRVEPGGYLISAATFTLFGLLVGIIADALRKNHYQFYDFRSLSEAGKISKLRKIMKI